MSGKYIITNKGPACIEPSVFGPTFWLVRKTDEPKKMTKAVESNIRENSGLQELSLEV
jgi:hypothetical protein